jgi:hypothetical protein
MVMLVGMLAVAAMATQNAMAKLAPTVAMTTNTTQLIIDLATLAGGGVVPDDLATVRQWARVTIACIVESVAGCLARINT